MTRRKFVRWMLVWVMVLSQVMIPSVAARDDTGDAPLGLVALPMVESKSLEQADLVLLGSGSIWTTRNDCGSESQDVNQYMVGDHVYVNGSNFAAGDYPFSIAMTGGAAPVVTDTLTIDSTGAFCMDAWTIPEGAHGHPYAVKVGNKNDNFSVKGDVPYWRLSLVKEGPVAVCYDPLNQTVTYAYTVTNNGTGNYGTFDITNIQIVDSLTTVTTGGPTLVAGVPQTFYATYDIPGGTTGPVVNTAQASGTAGLATIYSNEAMWTVTVIPPLVVEAGPDLDVCIDDAPFALTGESPPGGTWSGVGVSGGSFDPAVAGLGTHTITYSYTDAYGCSGSDTREITVWDLPVVDAGPDLEVCIDEAPFALTGESPLGGTWSGVGVSGGSFDPAAAGVGTHTITYTYTDAYGCSNSDTREITVWDLPVVEAGPDLEVCIDAAPFALAGGTPGGGTWSGAGVSGGTFDPAVAGLGTHTITYTYTDPGTQCSNSDTREITVYDVPVVDAGPDLDVCIDDAPFALTGESPPGGTWSGVGVSGGSFDPAVAGLGTHTITYSYTDAYGCSNSDTREITVWDLPVVEAGPDLEVCIDEAPFALTGESPGGGTWSGVGVSGGSFDPAAAGVGIHTITYTYTDPGTQCSNSDTREITVWDLPVVDAGPDLEVCIDEAPFALTGESPGGGTWSGTGVSGGNFDPAAAGVGAHTITYTYTDLGTDCTNSDTREITVWDLPVVEAGPDLDVCIDEAPFALTGGTPPGGTWSGTGVSGGNFDPAAAGLGPHTITYTYTDLGTDCTNSDTREITVWDLPVVDAGPDLEVCIDDAPFTLTGGTPPGGVWIGTGVSGGIFDPATAGVGIHTITYTWTDPGTQCSNSDTREITVWDLPVVDAGPDLEVCIDEAPFALTGESPGGGTWSGTGVSGGNFDPAAAGVGAHTITYTYTDLGTDCTNSDTREITVWDLPVVDAGPDLDVCIDEAPFALTGGSPGGGTWSGTGVSGGNFDPAAAGLGPHTITYTYTDLGTDCTNSDTREITVWDLPVVDAGPDLEVCIDDAPFTLTGGTPPGGVWIGTGVSGGIFDPATAGVGIHTITYTWTDPGTQCSNSDTREITVWDLPVVDAGPDLEVCIDEAPFALTGESPGGGTWSGTGVSGGNFDPAAAGVGAHTITYTYTDLGTDCTNSDTREITVYDLPVVDAGPDLEVCIDEAEFALTGGTPPGGSWSGTGVSGGNFDPATAGVGAHTITYTYTDPGTDCTNSDTREITVYDLPVVDAGPDLEVCIDEAEFALTGGTPPGGSWSGTGVSGGNFDPATAGVGAHTITYTYTDPGTDCTNSDTREITVYDLPVVDAGPDLEVCIDEAEFALTGGTPPGGTWSGTGVSGGNFDPATAGVGAHTITYTYTDPGTDCTNSDTREITVYDLPVVEAGPDLEVCIDEAEFALTGGTPPGGSWSGTGVSGGNFDPATAGVGAHTITYTYTDPGTDCTNSDTREITVYDLPVVDAGPDLEVCIDEAEFALTGGTPPGGTWSGTGVSGGNFDPATAGVGAHTITYTYTDPVTDCTNSDTREITVYDLPVVDAGPDLDVCIDEAEFALTGGTPPGGTWSGTGVSGVNFDPATAGVGAHTITYTYTDLGTDCTNSDTREITVWDLPEVDAGPDLEVCIDAAEFALTGGTPPGGTWSGVGVSAGWFDPATAGLGTHTITYTYMSDDTQCTNSDTREITVYDLPVVEAGPDLEVCIDEAEFALTGGTPPGGSWSGTGVSGGNFDPAAAGIGAHTITYTYTDAYGCSNSDTREITVYDLPVVDAGPDLDVCIDEAPFVLTGGTPPGGTWSGTGVSGGNFDPATAGVGAHTITYTYTDPGTDCTNSDTREITVYDLPVVDAGPDLEVCIDEAEFALTGGTPPGGSWSGTGVSGGNFDPATAGVGAHTITYTYTDPVTDCSNSDTREITVWDLPVVDAGPDLEVCIDEAEFALTGGTPPGGSWSGTGVSGGNFDPATAGVGAHTITYTYTDPGTDCTNSDTREITVYDLPVVDAGPDLEVCIDEAEFALTGGTPPGGSWSGTGVSGGNFDPATAGVGAHTITYTYTDPGTDCTNSDTREITVYDLPVVDAGPDLEVCIDEAEFALTGGSPGGGTWSGTGVSGGNFDPATAGVGAHTITYTYTDPGTDCTNSDTREITVYDLPVVDAGPDLEVCIDEAEFALTGGTPPGGSWSGTGVSGGNFDPATAGVGAHTITYTYTDPGTDCTNSDTREITVYDLPVVDAGPDLEVCIDEAEFALTGGSPGGGTWSGTGVSGGNFDPATAGVGAHTITYTYTDPGTDCTNSDTREITVYDLPVVDAGPDLEVCIDEAEFALTGGTPPGGSWSGTGVSGGNFDPATAGVGAHTITYTYTDPGTDCTNSDTREITVYDLPVVDAGPDLEVCIDEAEFALTGGTPPGGSWSGTGVSGGNFDPATAGVGAHTITYTYTDPVTDCSNSDTREITVWDLPVVDAGRDLEVCIDEAEFALTGGTPGGGTWSGTGVSAGYFDPATAGVGAHTITYTYTDPVTDCSNSDTREITVYDLPVVDAGPDLEVCIDEAEFALTGGTPGGGTWSGTGVSGGNFDPATAGVGAHTITYTYTDPVTDCSNSDTREITVNGLPLVTVNDAEVCEGESATLTATTVPATGVSYLWNTGETTKSIVVSTEGTYSVQVTIDATGCQDSASGTLTVYEGPTAEFSSDSPVWLTEVMHFTDESVAGDHPIVSWAWDFGDVTGTSIEQHPEYKYIGPGTYTVTLTVTDEFGCEDTVEHPVEVLRWPTWYICGYVRITGTDTGLPGAVVELKVRWNRFWQSAGTYTTGPDGFFEFTYTGLVDMFILTEINPPNYRSTHAVGIGWAEVIDPDTIRHTNPPADQELCHYIFYDELVPGLECPVCPDWFTFHTDRDENWEIYRRDEDGGLLNLSDNPATDMGPTRSPDALWVAYQSDRFENWDIFVVKEDGSETQQLTYSLANDTDPNWSDECAVRRIAFQSDRDGQWEIYIINADGTGLERMTFDEADDTDPFWSPDCDYGKIAFQSNRGGDWDIYVLNAETGEEYVLVDSPGNDVGPVWSPDASAVAFISDRDGQAEVYVVDMETGEETRITDSDGTERNIAWSPDSSWLAYQSDRDGQWDIYVSSGDGLQEIRVTEDASADEAPSWECGSERIVFHTDRDGDPEIYGINALTGEGLTRKTDNPANDLCPMWMPAEEDASLGAITPPRVLAFEERW